MSTPERKCISGETGRSDFRGDFFQMDDCRLSPRPRAPVKIVCAGQSERGMQFGAEYGDYNFVALIEESGSHMPHRWREMDSNLYGAFLSSGGFWFCCSLFGAGRPFLREMEKAPPSSASTRIGRRRDCPCVVCKGDKMAEETISWFAGVDWGFEKHQVCLLDAQGTTAGKLPHPDHFFGACAVIGGTLSVMQVREPGFYKIKWRHRQRSRPDFT